MDLNHQSCSFYSSLGNISSPTALTRDHLMCNHNCNQKDSSSFKKQLVGVIVFDTSIPFARSNLSSP